MLLNAFFIFFAIFSPKLPETHQILCTKIQEQNRTNIKHGQQGISRNIYVYLTNCQDIKEGSCHFQTPVGGTTVFTTNLFFGGLNKITRLWTENISFVMKNVSSIDFFGTFSVEESGSICLASIGCNFAQER